MTELQSILSEYRALGADARDAVLATVVHVEGSAYRRPGARMLLLPDGRRFGTVSGGCLEGEIARKAWWWTESQEASLRIFDTNSDDDAIFEFGLGCNGVVHVLLERLSNPGAQSMLDFLDRCQAVREPAVVATLIRSTADTEVPVGTHFLNGSTAQSFDEELQTHMVRAMREGKSMLARLECGDVFVEYVGVAPDLVLFGAGHDTIPLVVIAKQLGWHVTVADGRPAYAGPERFPEADRVVLIPAGALLANVEISGRTSVVLMTHNYPLDARLLPLVLAAAPRYIGLLGPRSRAERLFGHLGREIPAHVHAPIGLDIGSENPAAVALSIMAEIQADRSERDGGMLRDRNHPIHNPVCETGAASGGQRATVRPGYCEVLLGGVV